MPYIGLIDCILCMNTKKTIWTVYFMGHVSINVITVIWIESIQITVMPYLNLKKYKKNFFKKKNFFVKKKKFY